MSAAEKIKNELDDVREKFNKNKGKELQDHGRVAEDVLFAVTINFTRDLAQEWSLVDGLLQELTEIKKKAEKGSEAWDEIERLQQSMYQRRKRIKKNVKLNLEHLKPGTARTLLGEKEAVLITEGDKMDEDASEALRKELDELEGMVNAMKLLKKDSLWPRMQDALDNPPGLIKGKKRTADADGQPSSGEPARKK